MGAELLIEEQKYYESERERLLAAHSGKFALIKGAKLVGVFDTQSAAYEAGLTQLGNVPMLIVQLVPQRPVEFESPALHLGLISASSYS